MDRNFVLEKLYRQRKFAIWVLVFQSLLFMIDVGIYVIDIIQENIVGLAIISVVVGLLIPIIVLQCINIWLCTKNITNEKFRQEMFEADKKIVTEKKPIKKVNTTSSVKKKAGTKKVSKNKN